jgi:hypothetical protein
MPSAAPSPCPLHPPHPCWAYRISASSHMHSDSAGVSSAFLLPPSPCVNESGGVRRKHAYGPAPVYRGLHPQIASRPRNRSRSQKRKSRTTTRHLTRPRRGGGDKCSILFRGRCQEWPRWCDGEKGLGVDLPLDFFLPSPSLSTTSDRHCTDLPVGAWAPRRRRMVCVWVCWEVDGVVVVWVWLGAGCEDCCCRG